MNPIYGPLVQTTMLSFQTTIRAEEHRRADIAGDKMYFSSVLVKFQ